jgi:dTDP-4-amino-4,6-dideoxygalactose transaminase
MIFQQIPYFDLTMAPKELKDQWKEAVGKVIDSGIFIGGSEQEKFEKTWSEINSTKHSIAVGNGYDGLVLALKGIGIGKGDRVVVPAHTFIATWTAVKAVGAEAIGVDVNRFGLLDEIELTKIKGKVSAVIPVHIHGAVANMQAIVNWAKSKNVRVIEDSSQAHGMDFESYRSNSQVDVSVFSLYPTKNLGALGDAGVVTTNNHAFAESIRSHRNYGSKRTNKYEYENLGVNSRLDELQAAVLNINLLHLQEWNSRRIEIKEMYLSRLSEKVHFIQGEEIKTVAHHIPILVPNRDLVREKLLHRGIGTEVHYPQVAAHEYNRLLGLPQVEYPISEAIAKNTMSLPVSPWHTNSQIEIVCEAVLAEVENNKVPNWIQK